MGLQVVVQEVEWMESVMGLEDNATPADVLRRARKSSTHFRVVHKGRQLEDDTPLSSYMMHVFLIV